MHAGGCRCYDQKSSYASKFSQEKKIKEHSTFIVCIENLY